MVGPNLRHCLTLCGYFPWSKRLDRVGRLVVNGDGEPVIEPRYINVKELVECESVEESMSLLGRHSTFLFGL